MVLRLEIWSSVFISEELALCMKLRVLDESHLPLFVSWPVRKLSSPLLVRNTCVMWIIGIILSSLALGFPLLDFPVPHTHMVAYS